MSTESTMADEIDWSEAIQDYMDENGLTQEELADQLDTDQPRISKWLTGYATPSKPWQRILKQELELQG